MASEGGARNVLKWGCLGCLGCLGLVILVGLVVFGVAWLSARGQQFENEVRTHEPVASPAPAPAAEAPQGAPSLPSTPGRVTLHLGQGEVEVQAGRSGEPIRVEASYSKASHELIERFEQPSDGPWTYELTFEGRGTGLISWLSRAFTETPRITVFLPPDVPLELQLQVRQGAGKIDLGGLWLRSAEIDVSQGGGELAVSEPLREPMEQLVLRTSMGGLAVSRLGNASPAILTVENRMGGIDLDLRGAWAQDARISLDNAMGGMSVRLPRDVRLVGVAGHESPLAIPQGEIPPPTLSFEVSSDKPRNVEFH